MPRNNEDLSIWSPDDIHLSNSSSEDDLTKRFSAVSTRIESVTPSSSSSPTSKLARSAASSATLNPSNSLRVLPADIEDGRGVTASLILDGCRVPAATCRPFPVKSVGSPERMDFDIGSTKFTFSVRVSAGDIASDSVATEIYLPFVHYAAALHTYNYTPSASVNSSSADLLQQGLKDVHLSDTSHLTAPLKLDVNVRSSTGSYSIRGQYLIWRYAVPASGEEVYTIEVTRKGGMLVRDTGYVQHSGWGQTCPSCTIA